MIDNLKFSSTIDLIPKPLLILNDKKAVMSNRDFLEFLGYDSLETFTQVNSCIGNLFLQHDDYFSLKNLDDKVLWAEYVYEKKNNTVVSILGKNSQPVIFDIKVNKVEDLGSYYIVLFTDITTMHNEKKQLEKMAYCDSLTKIYNRRMFHILLKKEIDRQKRHNTNLLLVMCDIDHFKVINDSYGHDVGDQVLQQLSIFMSGKLRSTDVLARWGGEEFMILLSDTEIGVGYQKIQELKYQIQECEEASVPKITVSFGITEILEADKEQDYFKRVDRALYQAKIKRNDVIVV